VGVWLGVDVLDGVCDGVVVGVAVCVGVADAVGVCDVVGRAEGDCEGVTPVDSDAEGVIDDVGVVVAELVAVLVCVTVGVADGATHSVPGAIGLRRQSTLIVSAYWQAGDSAIACVMYVLPLVEHAKLSVVARCWPSSVVEQLLLNAPPVYDCEPRRKPDAHVASAVHAFQPAYEPALMPPLTAMGVGDGAITAPQVPAGHSVHWPAVLTAQQFWYSVDATFGLLLAMHTP